MNHRTASLAVSSLVMLAATAFADNEIIGTVEMSLDGDERTWYVLDPGGGMLPTALWLAMGPERGALICSCLREARYRVRTRRCHWFGGARR